jgi:hypothetical protein
MQLELTHRKARIEPSAGPSFPTPSSRWHANTCS